MNNESHILEKKYGPLTKRNSIKWGAKEKSFPRPQFTDKAHQHIKTWFFLRNLTQPLSVVNQEREPGILQSLCSQTPTVSLRKMLETQISRAPLQATESGTLRMGYSNPCFKTPSRCSWCLAETWKRLRVMTTHKNS